MPRSSRKQRPSERNNINDNNNKWVPSSPEKPAGRACQHLVVWSIVGKQPLTLEQQHTRVVNMKLAPWTVANAAWRNGAAELPHVTHFCYLTTIKSCWNAELLLIFCWSPSNSQTFRTSLLWCNSDTAVKDQHNHVQKCRWHVEEGVRWGTHRCCMWGKA